MVLKTIYVVRHGFRSNWVVDTVTGEYQSNVRSPTGIASDPALASYGVLQAKELAGHLAKYDIDVVYSSPFYRCLQTLSPYIDSRAEQHGADKVSVTIEPGLGEFYGLARFDHPSPATLEVLEEHFPHLRAEKDPVIVPSTKGESIAQLHDRVAYCLEHLVKRLDADPAQPESLLICTHAASMIVIGRALTGCMPDDETAEDFNCGTCSFSVFVRKDSSGTSRGETVESWSPDQPENVPDIGWRDNGGVVGGWKCEVNGDCSFLTNGEERPWHFSGDESFLHDPNAFNDAKNSGTTITEPGEGVNGKKDGARL